MTNKYHRLMADLTTKGAGSMKCFGNSMLPILSNPSVCDYQRQADYCVGDIVFCKVKGRFIDAHKITAVSKAGPATRYMIGNNHGFLNGWASAIYGRVIAATDSEGRTKLFA